MILVSASCPQVWSSVLNLASFSWVLLGSQHLPTPEPSTNEQHRSPSRPCRYYKHHCFVPCEHHCFARPPSPTPSLALMSSTALLTGHAGVLQASLLCPPGPPAEHLLRGSLRVLCFCALCFSSPLALVWPWPPPPQPPCEMGSMGPVTCILDRKE